MTRCPKCGVRLSRATCQGVRLLRCGECQGELVDEAALTALRRKTRPSRSDVQEGFLRDAAEAANARATLRCPRCHQPMEKIEFRECKGLLVDTCPECKIYWLDSCELEAMQIERDATLQAMAPEDRKHLDQLHRVEAALAIRRAAYERLRGEDVPGPMMPLGSTGVSALGALHETWRVLETEQELHDEIAEQSLRIAAGRPAGDPGVYVPWQRFRRWIVAALAIAGGVLLTLWWLARC